MPHWAQLLASPNRLTSQPLAGLASQLPQPGRHWLSTHTLFTHTELALGKLHIGQVQPPLVHTWFCGHWLPHWPQFLASVPVATSQPFLGSPSQSVKPWSHLV